MTLLTATMISLKLENHEYINVEKTLLDEEDLIFFTEILNYKIENDGEFIKINKN